MFFVKSNFVLKFGFKRTFELNQTSLRHVSAVKSKPKSDNSMESYQQAYVPSSSFVHNIFTGEAKVQPFFPYPKILNNEQLSFIDMITEPAMKMYANEYDALSVEKTGKIEPRHLQMMKDLGIFGIQAPQEYGGMGCNNTQFARLAETTAGFDLGVGVIIAAHQSIGYKGILLYGTEKQKRNYLPELASGEKIACFALTEQSGGSDAAGIKSKAILSDDGRYWILNGSKAFISNGGIAEYFTIFAQTPVQSKSGKTVDKITAFFVPKLEGISAGPEWDKMGIKASSTTDLFFDNVKIPVENVLGEVGEGFKVAMNILNNGRYGMVCALSGTMKRAIDIATAHANNRAQFGKKLASYTGIQEKIARMTMLQYTTQSMAYMLSGMMDNRVDEYQLEAAISKIYSSEAAKYVVDECLQILGGMGYMRETGVEKMVRDVRVFPVFEGTNDIMRLFVALTGLQYAGGHLKELVRSMRNPVANFGTIYEQGSRRIRRSVGFETVPDLSAHIHQEFSQESKWLSKNIFYFGASVEKLLIKHKNSIIHEQMLLNRLSNAAIDIYVMLVVLSRASRALNKNISSAQIEKSMTKVICLEANERINQNLDSLKSSNSLTNDETIRSIAKNVLQVGGPVHGHPLD